jgi:O-antigen ligase/polysaccharide polymerase Wzy-like membrane protein
MRQISSVRSALGLLITFAVAAAVFAIGLDSGGYSLAARSSVAIVVWWALGLSVALAVWPAATPTRAALVTGCLLAALAFFTGLSIAWAESAERAFNELNRVVLYLGVFTLMVAGATRGNLRRVVEGIALGIVAIGVLALASRLYPDLVDERVFQFLPGVTSRLSYPLDYWNGLGIFAGLGFPLLLGVATAARELVARWLAVAAIPVLTSVIYLTSSRGGAATAIVGAILVLALTSDRAVAFAAALSGAIGSAVAIAVLHARSELVDGPLESAAAASQGKSAALLIALACVVAGTLFAVATRFAPAGPWRVAGRTKAGLAAVAAVLAIAGVIAVDPAERFDTFKQSPGNGEGFRQEGFTQRHLLSGGGSGRWQFWQSAVDEFQAHTLAGGGAGSYETWWAQHTRIPGYFIKDAHSLYAETLAELGIIGLVLLLGVVGSGLGLCVVRSRAAPPEDRALVAALAGCFAAFAFAAAIDWVWELTVVGLVGIACLGLLAGPASASGARPAAGRGRPPWAKAARVALPVLALAVVVAQAIPTLASDKVRASQVAAARGDGKAALEDALAARRLQPWASSPRLQLALVQEQAGNLPEAREAIAAAIERDRSDWRLRLVSARLEAKSGHAVAARERLREAAQLNPRSPLFAR